MANLSELRKKYPQYDDIGDQEFVDKFHSKFYSDIPKDKFYSKVGFSPKEQTEKPTSLFEDVAIKSAQAIPQIASMAMSLPGELYGAATHPLQTLKNIPIGLAEGAAGAFNLPGNITRYAAEKGYFPKGLAKYAPHIPVEQIEQRLGLEAKEPGEALTRGISGFGPIGKLGKFSEASNLKKAGLGAAYSAGANENPLVGAILGSLPGAYEKGKQAYNYIKEPGRALSESKAALQDINHLISQQKEFGQLEKTDLAKFINQVQEGLSGRQEQLNSQLPELFPVKPKSETRSSLNTAVSNSINDLSENFENRYKDFYKEHGAKPINEPFEFKDINLDNVPHVSLTTKKMGYDIANDEITYQDSAGNDIKIKFPADNGTVRDYIDFSRELRDAAWDASKSAKNATYGEAKSLRKTSSRLRQLQGQAEERVKNSLSPEDYQTFRQIQDDYGQLMGAVKTDPALFNAAYKKRISEKLHDTLQQPINEHIRGYLYKNPEFTEAMREHMMQGKNHPLMKGAMVNPAAINGDLQLLLTPEQRGAQAEQLGLHHAQEQLNQVGQHVKNPETLTPQQEHITRQFHPRTAEYLSNEAQRRAITRNLEQQKSEQTMTKEEREKQLARRKALAAMGGIAVAAPYVGDISRFIKRLF